MPDSPDNQVLQVSPSQLPVPPAPLPPNQPFAAPPPKSGPSVLKIVLIVVATFFGIGLIGAGIIGYGVYRLAKNVQISNSSQPLTESDLGIAIYPGATQGKGTMRMTLVGKSMLTANYTTPDSEDKVIAFYKDKAGPTAEVMTLVGTTEINVHGIAGSSVGVRISQIASASGGKTLIIIQHVQPAATSK